MTPNDGGMVAGLMAELARQSRILCSQALRMGLGEPSLGVVGK